MQSATATVATKPHVFVYKVGVEVPKNVKHVRVDPSVTVIPKSAFEGCHDLVSVDLPEGLLAIGEMSFYECESLMQVDLPNGMQELGYKAFSGCKSLYHVNFPSTIRVISKRSFQSCANLIEVDLPDDAYVSVGYTFSGCIFPNFRVPRQIKSLRSGFFYECLQIFSMELPENLDLIETGAFNYKSLKSLRNIALPPQKCKCGDDLFGPGRDVASENRDSFENGLGKIFLPKDKYSPVLPLQDTIVKALKHRFDGLPLHKICYYQSYHPVDTTIATLHREIETKPSCWSRFLNRNHPKRTNIGREQDCLGMTPLHILACSTRQYMELFQILIEKFPNHLITKDMWGYIPIFYAVWGNAHRGIVELLHTSQKALFPDHSVQWKGMVEDLCLTHTPIQSIRSLLDTIKIYFPDGVNCQEVVLELATLSHIKIPLRNETFRCLITYSISDRLDSLNVKHWREEIMKELVDLFPNDPLDGECQAPIDDMAARTERVHSRLFCYEQLKEATTLLELALWKSKIDESSSDENSSNNVINRDQYRIQVGADIVVPQVLLYLGLGVSGVDQIIPCRRDDLRCGYLAV